MGLLIDFGDGKQTDIPKQNNNQDLFSKLQLDSNQNQLNQQDMYNYNQQIFDNLNIDIKDEIDDDDFYPNPNSNIEVNKQNVIFY